MSLEFPPYFVTDIHERPIFRLGDDKLGSGTYGAVYREDGHPNSVVKVYDPASELSVSVVREISSLVLLSKHQHIPQLHAVCLSDSQPRIALEMASCALSSVIGKFSLPEDHVKILLTQILQVLLMLENHNITHRDIKPSNILANDDYTEFMLCDFGLARFTDVYGTSELTGEVQTVWYRSPETITNYGKYDLRKVDIWSLGIVAIELLTGKPCLPAENSTDQLNQINKKFVVERNIRKMLPETVSDELVSVLDQMLRVDPKERLCAFELLKNPYFEFVPIKLQQAYKLKSITNIYKSNIKPSDLLFRNRMIKMIKETCEEFAFGNLETMFLAVKMFDLLLTRQEKYASAAKQRIHETDEKTMIFAIISLASKVHEESDISIEVISDNYPIDFKLTAQLEKNIFKVLDYMIFIPTVYNYLQVHTRARESELRNGDGHGLGLFEFVLNHPNKNFLDGDDLKCILSENE